mmetsp:Transcript_11072/g.26017  ORF Transcript_11072/g.26017 Transcript_11072/m.26017 type:complete len:203 (+) Transcript_11072:59-667(+)|eukprot:CAMPEP_0171107228 /NCGR_PEP_ID=MMETSP0766_2-20121228/66381_1 /TAXON_ID=439317 /ORGANISM="Gambierdiscus australes, Strain CAWD 149" /LENGTH=202 /DNA_ID=CAMNT_0011568485 /DNA_START=59 /DNA_END=667 /DNA_ORIENTATION=-
MTGGQQALPPTMFDEYARRILERFPKLFLALGSPNLHDLFELPAGDAGESVVSETAACMCVELRLRRRVDDVRGPATVSATASTACGSVQGQSSEEEYEALPFSRPQQPASKPRLRGMFAHRGERVHPARLRPTPRLSSKEPPSKELPKLLSAAALARLPSRMEAARRVEWVDPGKPMLSWPGSHDPWATCGVEWLTHSSSG